MNTTWTIRGTLTAEQRAELRAMSPEDLNKALNAKEDA